MTLATPRPSSGREFFNRYFFILDGNFQSSKKKAASKVMIIIITYFYIDLQTFETASVENVFIF